MTAFRPIRRGITLIEMMVAMALALGIMLILTESFKMALDFVRGAHSTGELMSQLNSSGILMTRDMQADHFIDASGNPAKLSNQRLDLPGWTPPPGGFFRIYAPDPGPDPLSPSDAQGFKINAPATNHQLHFTVVMPAGVDTSFTHNSGGGTYSSRAAEVAYFLAPMNKSTSVLTGPTGGLPLYNLIRRQRLVAVTTDEETSLAPVATDSEVISRKMTPLNPAAANTMATVMQVANRMNPPAQLAGTRFGEDIVVSNVLSFEVQADWTPGSGVPAPRTFGAGNTDAPYDFIPMTPSSGVFDTGVTPTPPMMARIKSIQVVIRVYDPRVKTTRQNTWKFAM
ncbi:PulJ/GspJ family protein [Gemmata sp.]|uniref:PulJ/GspJ family protein n=1 Tax=Gemmata sp. TaxID=1914242 RepID=UPI003F6F2DF4